LIGFLVFAFCSWWDGVVAVLGAEESFSPFGYCIEF
jgi:hypothetical protein